MKGTILAERAMLADSWESCRRGGDYLLYEFQRISPRPYPLSRSQDTAVTWLYPVPFDLLSIWDPLDFGPLSKDGGTGVSQRGRVRTTNFS